MKYLERTLLDLGNNTGNMVFTEAVLRVLVGARWGSFSLTPGDVEGRDCIVLAAANWINNFDDFGWLAERLEPISLPVFLVGVGAQATSNMEIPSVPQGTLQLLKLVSGRSASISVRGQFTADVLEHYGIKNASVTGCPSLLLAGAQGPQLRATEAPNFANSVIHGTRHLFSRASDFQKFLYRQAYKQSADILLQSELADMYFALGRTNNMAINERAAPILMDTFGELDLGSVGRYLRSHARVFTDFESWMGYMKTKAFCLGTRIHGTVAAIIAGTPATLITHDSRTLEMALSMSIPHISATSVDTENDLDLSKFVLPGQLQTLTQGYSRYFRKFMEFFQKNGLAAHSA